MVEDNNTTSPFDQDDESVCGETNNQSNERDVDGNDSGSLSGEQQSLELEKEIDELKNKFLRVSAEYDNYRKRTLKEKSELYNNGISDVIVNILPVLDNLERAQSVEGDIESFRKGVSMVVNMFYDVLSKLGVEEIDTTGKFDPNLHEAVSHICDEGLGENAIVEVLQKGYKTSNKVIRHSMVKVAN